MRSEAQVREVFRLRDEGAGASEIARLTLIPRSTVREWLSRGEERLARQARPHCADCGGDPHDLTGLGGSYAYLLGLYLGDGCLSEHRRRVFKLRVVLDKRYPGIIAGAAAAMEELAPSGNAMKVYRREGCVDVFAYWKGWPCLFPQHGPGLKHERPIVLSEWQADVVLRHPDSLLRGLIHSDGCRATNTDGNGWRAPRYAFSNRSDDIRRIFCDACRLVGVRTTFAPYTVYVSRKADVARLDEFIGPKR